MLADLSCSQAPGGRKTLRRPAPRRTTTTLAPDEDDEGVSEDCPELDGFFADALQCDKYYECSNGRIKEKLCPDGQVFNDFSIDQEKCDLPVGIDCTSRPELRKNLEDVESSSQQNNNQLKLGYRHLI